MKRHVLALLGTALLMVFGFAFAGSQSAAAQDFEPNIMDIAAADDRFDTLEAAIKAANLADTLASADNTFTVFAPTDDAFAKLPPALINALLADPSGALTDILLYHVVSGAQNSTAVINSDSLPTAQGQSLSVSINGGAAYVNNSQIIITDIQAKNGIIHVIDTVLVPDIALPAVGGGDDETGEVDTSNLPTIAEIAVANGNFDTLVAALDAAGLVSTFASPGDYTVFAPTDDAFAAIPAETLAALLADPTGQLTDILTFHVVGDSLSRDQLATDDFVPTLNGKALVVNRDGSNIQDISGANVVIYNIQASNGIIHVIDTVLIP